MSPEYAFKKHALAPFERLWLEEAARPGFFPRRALAKLSGKIPDDFRPELIDSRLYSGNRIKPIGLWLVDPQHPALDAMDRVIHAIKTRIPSEDVDMTVTALELASVVGIDQQAVGRAFQHLMDLGAGFFDQAFGPASSGGEGFDRIYSARAIYLTTTESIGELKTFSSERIREKERIFGQSLVRRRECPRQRYQDLGSELRALRTRAVRSRQNSSSVSRTIQPLRF